MNSDKLAFFTIWLGGIFGVVLYVTVIISSGMLYKLILASLSGALLALVIIYSVTTAIKKTKE